MKTRLATLKLGLVLSCAKYIVTSTVLFAQSTDEHLVKQQAMLSVLKRELPAARADLKQAVNAMNERGAEIRGLAEVTYQLNGSGGS